MTGRWRRVGLAAVCAVASGAATAGVRAQEVGGIAVSAATGAQRRAVDALLERVISVRLDRVPLRAALAAIAAKGGVQLAYSGAQLPTGSIVTLVADKISVGDAFHAILEGTDLEAIPLPGNRIAIAPRAVGSEPVLARDQSQGTATITGHVTDGALKTPLSEVTVRVEGTALRTTANADGKYKIIGVTPGAYRVTARRVGYQPLTKEITVTGDRTATLDFALVAAPTRLDEVVTTAVGEQRRYEVGNDISTINADSITPTAPITSLTDLISARAPGVTVLETSGMTGAGEAIRIEGLTSLVLQNDPILIVDGVRQDNAAGGDLVALFSAGGGYATHPTPTRLNDIDFDDIATIDILKGPAASTEYGTDAANGVIVITTKHGTAGAPQWKVSAEQTESENPRSFPNGYYSWGHTTDGTNTAVDCPLATGIGGANVFSTAGTCVVDSVTQWNPLNHASTTIFGTGDRGKYDLSVGGGSEAVRYFIAAGLSNETGMIRLPTIFQPIIDTANLGVPAAAFGPNTEQQRSVRANTSIRLSATADLATTVSYLSTFQQTPDASGLYQGVIFSPAVNDAAHYYGYWFGFASPIAELTTLGSQNTDRLTGGMTLNWRPAAWFAGHATLGLDHGSGVSQEINYPLANDAYQNYAPTLGVSNVTNDIYSGDLRGTATAAPWRQVRSVTSVGLQMVDNRTAGQTATVQNITSTNLTLNGVAGPTVTQVGTRQATLGGYAEEQLSYADRIFVTGALRLDAASGFGSNYATAAYPKGSVSWLAIDRGSTTIRIRGAFGESGVQPTNGAALLLYQVTVGYLNGAPTSVNQVEWPGNPNLRPERSEEFEGGVDIGGWNNRASLELTGYSKTTRDALVNVNLGVDLGNYTYQENVGSVSNTGAELSGTVQLLEQRMVAWSVSVNASVNHNKLLTLAPGVQSQTVSGPYVAYRQEPGYPLYGIWSNRATYADANNDGIIEPGEVTLADSASYIGPSLPTREISVSSHVGLWRGAVSIGVLADYRGGYRIANLVSLYTGGYSENQRAENDPTAPLWQQAQGVESVNYNFTSLNVEDGTFLRVRELSVTYALPRSLLRHLRFQSVSLTGAVRNLALWTRYSGVDPEVTNAEGYNSQYAPTSNGEVINNDLRADGGSVPLPRYWVLRLNLGL